MTAVEELIKAAEGMLAALPESDHEKYGGYRYGCTCPRCRLVTAVSNVKGEPPPKYLQGGPMRDQQVFDFVSKMIPSDDTVGAEVIWRKRALMAYRLGMIT